MGYLKNLKRSKNDPSGDLTSAQSDPDLRSEQSSGQNPKQAGLFPPPTTRRARLRDRLNWGSRSPSPLSQGSRSNTPDTSTASQPQSGPASNLAQARSSYSQKSARRTCHFFSADFRW